MTINCVSSVSDMLLEFTIDPEMPRNQLVVSSVMLYRSEHSPHAMLGFFNRGGSTRSWNQILADDAFDLTARLFGCLTEDVQAAYDFRRRRA